MRKKIVAGNWKMNTTLQEGVELARKVNEMVKSVPATTGVALAAPFTHLSEIAKVIDTERICLAAQNCSSETKGAFTGEISAEMLKSVGVKAVIIGHSERRTIYKEDDAVLNKKTKLALAQGLKVIFCIGEVLAEREAGKQFDVVNTQLEKGVFDLSAEDFSRIILAYEPVWAIGTGVTATSAQAQEIHKYIRTLLTKKYGAQVADDTTILYGGSCKASNAKELFDNADVDGGLIGGAALEAEGFLGIVKAI